ncbi:hypothetical protein BX667DRAFT_506523 [Coemansia mojavensis]|nr:hypothetical protein BX667DRAFT_506523 [Coemansia mojavensis]
MFSRLAALSLFSGSVSATGNIIAQYLDTWSSGSNQTETTFFSKYDPLKTARFFVYGVCFAPVSYRWHAFLNHRFPLEALAKASAAAKSGQSLSGKAAAVFKRISVDQIVFAPLASGAFVVGMGVLEGLNMEKLRERVRLQYPQVLLAGYLVWPAAQLINFSLVPLMYRVQFGSLVGLFWNTYLSWSSAHIKSTCQLDKPSSTTKTHHPASPTNGN